MCASSTSKYSRAFCPGATRALTRTRTLGISVLEAFLHGRGVDAGDVIDGWYQVRDSRSPVPIGSTPSSRPVSSRSCFSS